MDTEEKEKEEDLDDELDEDLDKPWEPPSLDEAIENRKVRYAVN